MEFIGQGQIAVSGDQPFDLTVPQEQENSFQPSINSVAQIPHEAVQSIGSVNEPSSAQLTNDELTACFTIHEEFSHNRRNSQEIINALRTLSGSDKVDTYERLIWYLMEITLTFDNVDIFSASNQSAREAVNAALDQLITPEQEENPIRAKSDGNTFKLPNEPITNETINSLIEKNCWTQALLISQNMEPSIKKSIMEMYIEREYTDDPYYTLLLVNQGSYDKLFELQGIMEMNWPKHLSFLLKNTNLCKKDMLVGFILALSDLVKKKFLYSASLFIKLIAGVAIDSFIEYYQNMGKGIRQCLLAEIIITYWNKKNINKGVALVETLYEKAYHFSLLNYKNEARATLKQINDLHVLETTWKIYPKLFKLAQELKGEGAYPEENKVTRQDNSKEKGFLNIIASAVSDLFPVQEKKTKAKAIEIEKQSNFYFDSVKGKWIIDGKEADAEYDLGQEPAEASQKSADVPLPPPTSGQIKENEPERQDDGIDNPKEEKQCIKDPFSGVKATGSNIKKKGGVKALYVTQL